MAANVICVSLLKLSQTPNGTSIAPLPALVCVCVCVFLCARARACAARVCVRACRLALLFKTAYLIHKHVEKNAF